MAFRTKLIAAVGAIALLAGTATTAGAGHNDDDHSKNIKQLANVPIVIQKDDPKTKETNEEVLAQGSDLAFRGDLLFAGSYEGPAVFKILKRKPYLKQLSFLSCVGSQGDISVYNDLLIVSVDSPRVGPKCSAADTAAASQANLMSGDFFEGLRLIDISNPRRPEQIGTVQTDCGSHTHTILPKGNKLYAYIESYPLGAPYPTCNAASHRKVSIVEIPLSNPIKSKVVGAMDVSPSIGCHDVTVFPKKKIAIAACITESQVWNIKNPAKPAILGRIRNPLIQIHHSSSFTWDGKYAILGDEFGGAAAGGCVGDSSAPVGAMWFYDITDPTSPQQVGYFGPSRVHEMPDDPNEAQRPRCTTHNFNILPMKNKKKYIVVSSFYANGLSAIDFSDPTNAKEIAHYVPHDGTMPDMWSGYWYNGRIYTNEHGSKRGVSVFLLKGTSSKEVKYFKGNYNAQVQVPAFR
jgi:LVIVD repeat